MFATIEAFLGLGGDDDATVDYKVGRGVVALRNPVSASFKRRQAILALEID
jgi:hypothetical protein